MATHANLLIDTYFTDNLTGWVVGGKIQFLTPQIGFVSLENMAAAAILKTTDGGETWKRIVIKDQQGNVDLEGVGFIDEKTGWAGGWGDGFPRHPKGTTSGTTDGGANWFDANEVGHFLNRFRFVPGATTGIVGYASGDTIYQGTVASDAEFAAARLSLAGSARCSAWRTAPRCRAAGWTADSNRSLPKRNRSLPSSPSKFRILKIHRAETRRGIPGLRRESLESPRRRPDPRSLTCGNVGASVSSRNRQGETALGNGEINLREKRRSDPDRFGLNPATR
jgi:hypothetical protein